ncbi:MAG: Arginine-tRNA ligase [candidate division TM6 bacterium GW2011_GWA2_36_9]|nr:MAG: Arginine-tRNA ligase [candidate division TM6 bacterium GW2011_GWA2_36_9]
MKLIKATLAFNLLVISSIYSITKKWEAGDKPTIALWKKMNDWVLQGIKETYKELGIKYDVYNY